MKDTKYIEDRIDRYVYQVGRFLMGKNKDEIEREIRALIYDMLEQKSSNEVPSKEILDSVLTELGKPILLAAKYNDSTKYLIGPALYPLYVKVLSIALSIILSLVAVGSILALIMKSSSSWDSTSGFGASLGSVFGNVFLTALVLFGVLTVVFSLIERGYISINEFSSHEITAESLPPVPVPKERIPKSEPIISIIFSVIFTFLFLYAPQVFGFWQGSEGQWWPVLNVEVIKSIAYIFVIIFCITIAYEIFRLVEGRYTFRLMLATIISNAITVILWIIVLKGFPIWNEAVTDKVRLELLNIPSTASWVVPPAASWHLLVSNALLAIIIFATLINTITCIVKTVRYAPK